MSAAVKTNSALFTAMFRFPFKFNSEGNSTLVATPVPACMYVIPFEAVEGTISPGFLRDAKAPALVDLIWLNRANNSGKNELDKLK